MGFITKISIALGEASDITLPESWKVYDENQLAAQVELENRSIAGYKPHTASIEDTLNDMDLDGCLNDRFSSYAYGSN
jgi:hypothetical protein